MSNLPRRGLLALALTGVTLTAACGSSAITTSDAATYFRQQIASHYGGHTATGDGRGCLKTGAQRWECTGYVQGPGVDVIGTVTVSGPNMTLNVHPATERQTRAWFAKTPGGAGVSS